MLKCLRALVFAAVVGGLSHSAHGQLNLSLGVEGAYPSGGLADLVEEDLGYGAHAALTWWLNYRYQIIASGAYVTYGSGLFDLRSQLEDLDDLDELPYEDQDDISVRVEGNYTSIPIMAGVRFYPLEKLFLQGSAGVVYKRTLREVGPNETTTLNPGYVTKRDLIVSPAIGVLMGRFSLQAQYNLAQDDWKWFSLGISAIFGKM